MASNQIRCQKHKIDALVVRDGKYKVEKVTNEAKRGNEDVK